MQHLVANRYTFSIKEKTSYNTREEKMKTQEMEKEQVIFYFFAFSRFKALRIIPLRIWSINIFPNDVPRIILEHEREDYFHDKDDELNTPVVE